MEELVKHLLPAGLLEYFEVVRVVDKEGLYIHLDEKNLPPKLEKEDVKLVSKGFYESITIQDFPIRDKVCYLTIRRRKWLDEATGHLVNNKWKLAAKGTRMTKELASFLKGTDRQSSH